MPKYMIQATYVGEGINGLLEEGGTKRREAVSRTIEEMGGILESFYYTFGDSDVIGIADMPDNISSAAFSLIVNASGIVNAKTTVLISAAASQLENNVSRIDSVVLDPALSQSGKEHLLLNPYPRAQYGHSHQLLPPVFFHLRSQFQDDR